MSLVLVADDEPAVLEVLTEVVEDLGHDVVRAHDGREALMIARSERPNLVVTDHMMPRLSGLELCRAMRQDELLQQVPVILLSAALPPEASEAFAYLAKPFELDEFEALVKRTLEGIAPPALPPPPRLVKSAALTAAEELVSWVAHEMKTPLAAARMNLQLLERRATGSGPPPERQHFAAVARQLENMEQVVNALLDAAMLSEGRLVLALEPGDLRDQVARAVDDWRELRPDFDFTVIFPEQPVQVRIDQARLRQAISNLISNAVKYGAPPRQVRIELGSTGEVAEVRVQDFGPGIAAAAQRTIFQRFRTADEGPRGKGHGLGLYIAAELARLHGGAISVKSALGQGATFTLTLPLAT